MDLTAQAILEPLLTTFSVEVIRYLIAVSLVITAIFFITKRGRSRNLHTEPATAEQKRREVFYSILTALVFSVNGLYVYFGMQGGWALVYEDINQYPAWYLPICLIAMIIAHDAYFYWTHRLIHHRFLFRWVHHTHHRSIKPTAWAAYAFAPGEAFINGLFVPIWVTFVPTYEFVAFFFLAHMILRNAIGHSGYELFPIRMPGSKAFGWITNVFHHDLHHRDIGENNFGLYFTWWDRWMGTEHPEYTQIVEKQKRARLEIPAS